MAVSATQKRPSIWRPSGEEAKVDIDIRPFLEGGPLGLMGMVLAWLLYRIEGKLERFARSNEELI